MKGQEGRPNVPEIAHLERQTFTQDAFRHAVQFRSHKVPTLHYDDFEWEAAGVREAMINAFVVVNDYSISDSAKSSNENHNSAPLIKARNTVM